MFGITGLGAGGDELLDIETTHFEELLNLEKRCDKLNLDLPVFGEQLKYGVSGIFKPDEHFVALVNRKGHVRTDNLTFMMRSKTSGVMFRFDVVGSDHNGIPTPHLHVFDSRHDNGRQVLYGEALGSLNVDATDPDILIKALTKFLAHNHVELSSIAINGTTL